MLYKGDDFARTDIETAYAANRWAILRAPSAPASSGSSRAVAPGLNGARFGRSRGDNEEGSVWSRGEMPAADTERDHIEAVLN
jgi:hypothetical protein